MFDIKTTPATAWVPKTYLRKLPSGKIVELKPIGTDFFAKLGRIPNSIAPYVMQLFKGTNTQSKPFEADSPDKIQDLLTFMDIICESVFVKPIAVMHDHPNREAGEISVNDIDIQDKTDVLEFFTTPAEQLKSFRPEQDGDVDVVDNSAGSAGEAQ